VGPTSQGKKRESTAEGGAPTGRAHRAEREREEDGGSAGSAG
jgi:hypothetical protein